MKKHLNLYLEEKYIYLLKKLALDKGKSVSDVVVELYEKSKEEYPKDVNDVPFSD